MLREINQVRGKKKRGPSHSQVISGPRSTHAAQLSRSLYQFMNLKPEVGTAMLQLGFALQPTRVRVDFNSGEAVTAAAREPRHRDISHSSLQERQQVCRARVRRHTVFHNLAPLPEHSADILVPPRQHIPAQSGFFRSHLLMIRAAKPRYTAAAAREHRRILAPLLSTPGASVTSPLHTP